MTRHFDTPRPPTRQLVGRSDVLVVVEACLAAGDSVVFEGPSGIGKSALLDALAASAQLRGELVLRASGAESERWMAYQGLADLLGLVPPEHLAALTVTQRTALLGIVRGASTDDRVRGASTDDRVRGASTDDRVRGASTDDRVRGAGTDDRGRTARKLGWLSLLDRCAAHAPVLLLIDDAHWLDGATAEVFAYAARRLVERPVRVVLAGRWPASGPPLALAPPPVTAMTVPPLTADDIAALLGLHGLPARAAAKIHADSAGNPYLALALAGGFTDRHLSNGRQAALAPRVHALIQDNLNGLSDQVRETLLVCALSIRPSVRLLLRAARPDAESDVALAAEAGLVVTDGENIRFTPPEAATVVAQLAGATRRAEVHLMLAGVVMFSAEVDRHRALASADPDGEAARSLVVAAEAALRRGARDLAAELYLLAADRTPADLEAQRVEWLVAAAEVGAAASLPAIVHQAATAVLAAEAAPAQRVRVRIALVQLSGQGMATMEETFAAAQADAAGDPASLAWLHLWRGWAAMIGGNPVAADADAERAVDLARRTGDVTTEAMALSVRAQMARVLGRLDYMDHLDKGLALAHPAVDGRRHMSPRYTAARFATIDDRLDEARADLLRMLAMVERGAAEELLAVLRGLAEVAAKQGRCTEALDYADRAIRVAGEAGLSPGPGWCSGAVAELAGGTLARAVTFAERAVRASEEEHDFIHHSRSLHALGQARLRRGDIPGAVEAMRRIQEGEKPRGIVDPTMLRWHGDLAMALVLVGEMGEAERTITAARDAIAARPHSVGVDAQLDRAEAALVATKGDSNDAVKLLQGALAVFESLGQPIEPGHCLLVEAIIERRRRHYTAARAAADTALELFTAVRAKPWIQQADDLLVRLSDIGDTGGELTASEARIAELVDQGASNREIADRLYLSVKTVEATLTRIYRKLGIRSRTQLSRRLRSS